MMQIKALMIAAACALVLPAFAADTDKSVDKPKAEANAVAKKPVVREKVAGEVLVPDVKKDTVEVVTAQEPYSLRNSRWVPKEDRN
jgi:hypothetical protein